MKRVLCSAIIFSCRIRGRPDDRGSQQLPGLLDLVNFALVDMV